MSSNDSLRRNSCFVHRLPTSTLHEPATSVSNHPRARARTESLGFSSPKMPCQPSLQLRSAASKPTISLCNCRAHSPTATLQIIRTRSAAYKPHRLPRGAASFKSLYLRRPPNLLDSTTCRGIGASDTALRLLARLSPRGSTSGLPASRPESPVNNPPLESLGDRLGDFAESASGDFPDISLFSSQCVHRVEPRSTPCGDDTGESGHCEQDYDNYGVNRRIEWLNLIE